MKTTRRGRTSKLNLWRGCQLNDQLRRVYTTVQTRTERSLKWYSTDEMSRLVEYCERNRIKYLIGNDAPKGGKMGTYITFNTKTYNTICK